MPLETEIKTYAEKLPELLAEQGRFVLVCGKDVIATFAAYEDALAAGYEKCGVKPFLVKRISAVEQANFFSRSLELCPS